MKSYANFGRHLADQSPKHQVIIRRIRKFVRRTAPSLEEAVKWGNGCWVQGKGFIAYVYSDLARNYVQFGFLKGSMLKDPKGLLHGNGQYVRHIKVSKTSDIDERAFSALLKQAVRLGPPSFKKNHEYHFIL